jgi:hypothetical protein
MAGPQAQKNIQVDIGEAGCHISRGATVIDITPAGEVTVTGRDVKLKAVLPEAAAAQNKSGLVSISKDFNTVAAYGTTVRLEAENILVETANIVTLKAAPEEMKPKEIKIGTRMEDGWIYGGISPSNGQPMFVAPADEKRGLFKRQLSTPEKARKRAAKKSRETGHECRVPTYAELKVLFNNRAAIGGFNENTSYPYNWYRSYTPGLKEGEDRRQLFSTGAESNVYSDYNLSVRLVRN